MQHELFLWLLPVYCALPLVNQSWAISPLSVYVGPGRGGPCSKTRCHKTWSHLLPKSSWASRTWLSVILYVLFHLDDEELLCPSKFNKSEASVSSVTQSCPSLCYLIDCSTPGFPVLHCLLELAETHVHWVSDAIQPSHPLSSPSPPTFNLSQHQGLFQWASSSHQEAKLLGFWL